MRPRRRRAARSTGRRRHGNTTRSACAAAATTRRRGGAAVARHRERDRLGGHAIRDPSQVRVEPGERHLDVGAGVEVALTGVRARAQHEPMRRRARCLEDRVIVDRARELVVVPVVDEARGHVEPVEQVGEHERIPEVITRLAVLEQLRDQPDVLAGHELRRVAHRQVHERVLEADETDPVAPHRLFHRAASAALRGATGARSTRARAPTPASRPTATRTGGRNRTPTRTSP